MLSRPILEIEGMDAILLKEGKVKEIYKIQQFLTLFEKGTHLGAISETKNKNQIYRELVVWLQEIFLLFVQRESHSTSKPCWI